MKDALKKVYPYTWKLLGGFLLLIIVVSSVSWYGYNRFQSLTKETSLLNNRMDELSNHLAILEDTLASTSASLEGAIAKTHETLASEINQEKENVQNISSQVGNISGTVTTLQKLSKTDPELLNKYSKVYFLNENYVPERLVAIDQAYAYSNSRVEQVHAQVWPYMKAMLDQAKADGITIYVKSAYRSFDEQKALNGAYSVIYGAERANQFSALQGYSEHQLGTTADFITTGLGGELTGFEKTSAYQWMLNNAYKYGFVISYPETNSFYIFEPWHWRFVGVKLATDLHNQGKHFYDLDQRAIDEYLVNIFD